MYSKIPLEMKRNNRWLLYRCNSDDSGANLFTIIDKNDTYIDDGDFVIHDKVIMEADPDDEELIAFDEAMKIIAEDDAFGLCYVPLNDEYVLTISEAIDPNTNRVKQFAREIVDAMGSYTEKSIKEDGLSLRIFFRVTIDESEEYLDYAYDNKCYEHISIDSNYYWYFISGNPYKRYRTLRDCTDIIDSVLEKYLLDPARRVVNNIATYSNIPESMKNKDRWLLCDINAGDPLRYLYNPNVKSVSGIRKLYSFADAVKTAQKHDNLGLCYKLDCNECAITIRSGIDPNTNRLSTYNQNVAQEIVDAVGNYIEIDIADKHKLNIFFTIAKDDIEKFLAYAYRNIRNPYYISFLSHQDLCIVSGNIYEQYGELKDCTDVIDSVLEKHLFDSRHYKPHKDIIIDEIINDTNRIEEFIMDETTTNTDRKDEPVMDEPITIANQERVITVLNINDLVEFNEQPFKPYGDAELDKLAESIKTHGVMEPILVRPYKGQHQIISGHNRVLACKKLDSKEIHAIIEEMDDDTATLRMVDANFKQRQGLSISERASAYKLVLDIHQKPGNRTDLDDDKQPRDKVDTRSIRASDIIGSNENRSGRTISRLVRLTELTNEFLADVDVRKLGTTTAEAISYLAKKEQKSLHSLLKKMGTKITFEQAKEMKKVKEDKGEIDNETMLEILTAEKPEEPTRAPIELAYGNIARFFEGEDLSDADINSRIIEALEFYQMNK